MAGGYISVEANRTRPVVEHRALERELQTAVEDEARWRRKDDMKKKAITTAPTYDDFKNMVAASDLRPIQTKEVRAALGGGALSGRPGGSGGQEQPAEPPSAISSELAKADIAAPRRRRFGRVRKEPSLGLLLGPKPPRHSLLAVPDEPMAAAAAGAGSAGQSGQPMLGVVEEALRRSGAQPAKRRNKGKMKKKRKAASRAAAASLTARDARIWLQKVEKARRKGLPSITRLLLETDLSSVQTWTAEAGISSSALDCLLPAAAAAPDDRSQALLAAILLPASASADLAAGTSTPAAVRAAIDAKHGLSVIMLPAEAVAAVGSIGGPLAEGLAAAVKG